MEIEHRTMIIQRGGSGYQPRNVRGAIFSSLRLVFGQNLTI
jgi:hypothetical protein